MPRTVYADDLKIKEALPLYFSKYHFENGGYHLKWFKIKVGPVFIPLPNINDRIDAVKIHDIHHLITEYPANLKGEAEIGAWEIASGCGNYWVAWILNFGSLSYGILFFPKAIFNAFMNARKCKTNFYYNTVYDEQLLNKTVGELRDMVGVDQLQRNTAKDYFYFILWSVFSLSAAFLFFYVVYRIIRLMVDILYTPGRSSITVQSQIINQQS